MCIYFIKFCTNALSSLLILIDIANTHTSHQDCVIRVIRLDFERNAEKCFDITQILNAKKSNHVSKQLITSR